MSSNSSTDVLIVGAGPVGLTLANELARYGVAFRLVDKAPEPSTTSKALAIHARTLEMLHDMGLAETFVKQGLRVGAINMYAGKKRLQHVDITEVDSPYNFVLNIPQNETEALLIDALAQRGQAVERECELLGFTQDESGVQASLRSSAGEEQLTTQYIVGCDGGHSRVRKQLDLPFVGEAYDEHFVLADIHVDWELPVDELYLFLSPDGMFLMFPMKNSRFRIVATVDGKTEPELDQAYFERLLVERDIPTARLYDPVWFSHFKIHHRKVPRYRVGRGFLAGDAAHIHSPMGGQGMNTGMQDAYNLAWKLALKLKGKADLLDSYNAEREPIGREVLTYTDRLTQLASLKHPLATAMRDRILPVLSSVDFIRQKMRDKMEEMDIAYADSPITDEVISPKLKSDVRHAFLKAAPIGMRAHDGVLTDANSGSPIRLIDIFQTRRHTLMLFLHPQSQADEQQEILNALERVQSTYSELIRPLLITGRQANSTFANYANCTYLDVRNTVHDTYGVTQTSAMVLIRPDVYIGFRSLPANTQALERYLEQLFKV